MKTVGIVTIWDQPCKHGERGYAVVGVNWSAVGPVTPATARRVANRLLQAADAVEERIATYKADGIAIKNPETNP